MSELEQTSMRVTCWKTGSDTAAQETQGIHQGNMKVSAKWSAVESGEIAVIRLLYGDINILVH